MELLPGWFDAGGARIGAATHAGGRTGCTVVLLPGASPYAVHLGGGASSLRQVAAQVPGHSVQSADAFLLTGGSAYGLDAAGGVLRALEAMGRGTPVGRMRVPAVPAAALYDLALTGADRPDGLLGEQAVRMAEAGGRVEGRVGAGAGATVGKALGIDRACPGGQAVATAVLREGVRVSAV
ncbi:P1 family peptidase, partial [Myxococcota bacterium]|nr:P1 family peptidase [Myxococcota bacterium]